MLQVFENTDYECKYERLDEVEYMIREADSNIWHFSMINDDISEDLWSSYQRILVSERTDLIERIEQEELEDSKYSGYNVIHSESKGVRSLRANIRKSINRDRKTNNR